MYTSPSILPYSVKAVKAYSETERISRLKNTMYTERRICESALGKPTATICLMVTGRTFEAFHAIRTSDSPRAKTVRR